MPHPLRRQIMDELWPPGYTGQDKVWTILDGARNDDVYPTVLTSYSYKTCLYAGPLPPELEVASPYLVQMEFDDRFTWKVIDAGWGQSWGVFLKTDTGFEKLRKHLRQFLLVKDDRGKRLIFRYYDPRVLRVYLPTCTEKELQTVFGPIREFLMEGEDPNELLTFGLKDGKLTTTVTPLVRARAVQ